MGSLQQYSNKYFLCVFHEHHFVAGMEGNGF